MTVKKTRAKVGSKNQHESQIVHHEETAHGEDALERFVQVAKDTAWQYDPAEILRRLAAEATAFLKKKGLPTEWKTEIIEKTTDSGKKQTGVRRLRVAKQIEEATQHPETRPRGDRGLVAVGQCLDLYKGALQSAEEGDYKAALLCVLQAIPNEKLAVIGDMEPRWHAGRSRTGEGAAEKKAQAEKLKERVRPQWERLIKEGHSRKRAGELIAAMKTKSGELLAEGRKGGTITDWFENEELK